MKTFPTLYHRSAKGAVVEWTLSVSGNTLTTTWGQRSGQMQTATQTVEGKSIGRSNETSPEEQALKEAQSLFDKKLRTKYSTTLEESDSDESISPMLAKKWEDHKKKVRFPALSQPKLDGLRAIVLMKDGKVVIQSRGNKTYSLPHIEAELAPLFASDPELVLDGELYKHGVSLQTINSWVRGKKKEAASIEYHVYDLVMDGGFSHRHFILNSLFMDDGTWENIVKVATVRVENEDEVISVQADFVSQGYEGSMVRTMDGEYRAGYRSDDLLKVKNWVTEEFPIVGHKVGKGKFENVPMIVCSLPNGGTVDVTPTGTMAERKELLDNIDSLIGKPYTVKYFGLSPYGVPLYPTGVGVRYPEDMS